MIRHGAGHWRHVLKFDQLACLPGREAIRRICEGTRAAVHTHDGLRTRGAGSVEQSIHRIEGKALHGDIAGGQLRVAAQRTNVELAEERSASGGDEEITATINGQRANRAEVTGVRGDVRHFHLRTDRAANGRDGNEIIGVVVDVVELPVEPGDGFELGRWLRRERRSHQVAEDGVCESGQIKLRQSLRARTALLGIEDSVLNWVIGTGPGVEWARFGELILMARDEVHLQQRRAVRQSVNHIALAALQRQLRRWASHVREGLGSPDCGTSRGCAGRCVDGVNLGSRLGLHAIKRATVEAEGVEAKTIGRANDLVAIQDLEVELGELGGRGNVEDAVAINRCACGRSDQMITVLINTCALRNGDQRRVADGNDQQVGIRGVWINDEQRVRPEQQRFRLCTERITDRQGSKIAAECGVGICRHVVVAHAPISGSLLDVINAVACRIEGDGLQVEWRSGDAAVSSRRDIKTIDRGGAIDCVAARRCCNRNDIVFHLAVTARACAAGRTRRGDAESRTDRSDRCIGGHGDGEVLVACRIVRDADVANDLLTCIGEHAVVVPVDPAVEVSCRTAGVVAVDGNRVVPALIH